MFDWVPNTSLRCLMNMFLSTELQASDDSLGNFAGLFLNVSPFLELNFKTSWSMLDSVIPLTLKRNSNYIFSLIILILGCSLCFLLSMSTVF